MLREIGQPIDVHQIDQAAMREAINHVVAQIRMSVSQ
jgi:hypothetical protein